MSKRWLVGSGVVLAAAGTALATISMYANPVSGASNSPGFYYPGGNLAMGIIGQGGGAAAGYASPVMINTAALNHVPPGYGDVIVAVEEGRDDISPYASISFVPGTGHSQADLAGFGVIANYSAPAGAIPYPPGTVTLVYRPTNDPCVTGWGQVRQVNGTVGPFAAMGEVEQNLRTCHAVAEQLRAFWKASDVAATGTNAFGPAWPPAPYWPTLWIETSFVAPPNPGAYALGEFYKFRVQTAY